MGGEPIEAEAKELSHWRERALKAEAELELSGVDSVCDSPGFEDRKLVFDSWVSVFKKNSNAKFKAGDARDRKLQARLKEWTSEELIKAIGGYSMDPWRHEAANRHEFSTLIRDNAQIEQGIDIFSDGGKRARTARLNNSGNGKGPAGNSTVDYTDQDRARVGGITDFGGNPLHGRTPERTDVQRNDPMDFGDLF